MRPSRLAAAVATILLCGVVVAPGTVAARPPPVQHQAPVDAPLIDRFRPPASPYGAGNRGVDYATAPGTEVRASAPGVVTFAGAVGGRLHVVVRHADGVRTSYSFLATTAVVQGQMVDAGLAVGTTGSSLHFGARVGEDYIDPLTLLEGSSAHGPRLVRDDATSRPDEGDDRRALGRLRPAHSGAVTPVPAWAVTWARFTRAQPVS